MSRHRHHRSSKDSCGEDRLVKTLIKNINETFPQLAATKCPYHFARPCITLINNSNTDRFHCLYTNSSVEWKLYSPTSLSADIPEHYDDLISLEKLLGHKYVLSFAGQFREPKGYCIGMYRLPTEVYPPLIISRQNFKETLYTLILIYCAVCRVLGGIAPDIKQFSFVYTQCHPILTDIGSINSDNRERISSRLQKFNAKKWRKFLTRRTTRDMIRYAKDNFPFYFQKMKNNCILQEPSLNDYFDDETHELICKSRNLCLLEVLMKFRHLMPCLAVRGNILFKWFFEFNRESEASGSKQKETSVDETVHLSTCI